MTFRCSRQNHHEPRERETCETTTYGSHRCSVVSWFLIMYSRDQRQHVAWDIETTGLCWSDSITTSGFWLPQGTAEMVVNTAGKTINQEAYEEYLREHCGVPLTIHPTPDETALLEKMQRLIFEKFEREANRLIGFHADSWHGGFDLPFLRSACLRCGVEWIFDGLEFVDLWDLVKKHLNTTKAAPDSDSEQTTVQTLEGTYTMLCAESAVSEALDEEVVQDHRWYHLQAYDPFADSDDAVAFFKRREFLPVIQHNLADIHRTWELGEIVREYVSPRDFTTKTL